MMDRKRALEVMGFEHRQEVTQRILNDRYLDLRMQTFGTSGQEARLAEYAQAYEALDLKERECESFTMPRPLQALAEKFESIIDRSVYGMQASTFAFFAASVSHEDTIRGWLDSVGEVLENADPSTIDMFMQRLLKLGKHPEEACVILKLLQKGVEIDTRTFYVDNKLKTLIQIADQLMDSDNIVINDITALNALTKRLEKCGIESDQESGVYFTCALVVSQNVVLKQSYQQQEIDRFAARVLFAVDVPLNHSKWFFDNNRVHGNMLTDTPHQDQARALGVAGQNAPVVMGHNLALPMPNLDSSENSIVAYTGIGLVALAAAAFAARALGNFRQ